jgi:hypothetical protein
MYSSKGIRDRSRTYCVPIAEAAVACRLARGEKYIGYSPIGYEKKIR